MADISLDKPSKRKPVKYVSASSYTLTKNLGSGTFGEVWLATDPKGKKVAVKFMDAAPYEGYSDTVLSEIAYPLSLDHPNIVKYHAILGPDPISSLPKLDIDAKTVIGVVMDEADGDLLSLIRNHKKLLMENFQPIAYQLADALAYITSHNIIHRDLKPENILYRRCPSTSEVKVTIIDFGTSIIGECYNESKATRVYTLPYRPPELFFETEDIPKYDGKADVWALGCIFYEMYTSKILFNFKDDDMFDEDYDEREMYRTMVEKLLDTLKPIQSENPELCELLKGMLKADPEERMSIFDVRNDTFFRDVSTTKGSGCYDIIRSPKIPCIRRSEIFDRDLSFNRFAKKTKDKVTSPAFTERVVGWLLTVFRDLRLTPMSVYFSTIQLFCRFAVIKKDISLHKLQLYAVVALATAYEAVSTDSISWHEYVYLTAGSITVKDIAEGQVEMMKALNFDVLANTPFDEIRGYTGQVSDKIIYTAGNILAHLSKLPYYFDWYKDRYKYRRNLAVNCLALASIGLRGQLPVLFKRVSLRTMGKIIDEVDSSVPILRNIDTSRIIGIEMRGFGAWNVVVGRFRKFQKSYSSITKGLIIGATDEINPAILKEFEHTSFYYYNADPAVGKSKVSRKTKYDIVIVDCDLQRDDLIKLALKFTRHNGAIYDKSLVKYDV